MAHLLQNNRSWDSCSSNLWETQVSLGEQMMHQGISHTMVKLSLQETHNQVLHLEVVYSRCYCKTDVIVLVMNGKAATLQEFCPWIHMNNQWTLTCGNNTQQKYWCTLVHWNSWNSQSEENNASWVMNWCSTLQNHLNEKIRKVTVSISREHGFLVIWLLLASATSDGGSAGQSSPSFPSLHSLAKRPGGYLP